MSPNVPTMCYALCPDDKTIIQIRRGELGFYRTGHGIGTQEEIDDMNKTFGVTPAQREAMLAGSMFGWGCPGAQPEAYDEAGEPLRDFPKTPITKLAECLAAEYVAGRNKPIPRGGV